MIQSKYETEDLLLSITKNCETLIKQTHGKAEETLEFKLNKPRETFHVNPPISVEGSWMIGLTSLEVYFSNFNVANQKNNFEIYTVSELVGEESIYETVGNLFKEKSGCSEITEDMLDDETTKPITIEKHTKTYREINHAKPLIKILHRFNSSMFQDFESFLRTEIDLVEDDMRLILDEYNSSFITYELKPGIYTFYDFSKVLLTNLQREFDGDDNAIDIEIDDFTKKAKLVVRSGIIAIRFDENSVCSTIPGLNNCWDYKHYIEQISQRMIKLSSIKKIHLKCDVIDGSIQNGLRQPILYSFVSDKPSGYNVF